jgi:hypothetical protein
MEKPEKGLPENECYVIIILLHHYPFSLSLSMPFQVRRKESVFEFLSNTLGKVEKYFNFVEQSETFAMCELVSRLIHLLPNFGIKATKI